MKQKRKEADLKNVISQIGGLENRIKYSQNDLDNTENRNERDFIQVSAAYQKDVIIVIAGLLHLFNWL